MGIAGKVEHNLCVHMSVIKNPNFTKFSMLVTHGCGLVLWWRWSTSGLVDDVIFSHNVPYDASRV